MEHQKAIQVSRHQRLVADNKFDSHMKRARLQDIDSRKQIFDNQTENGLKRRENIKKLKTSVY